MNKVNVTEFVDRWTFPVENLTVTQLRIDYSLVISLWVSKELFFDVTIEAPFQLIIPNKEPVEVVPETLDGMCSALNILHQVLLSATVFKKGTLELFFLSGSQIIVVPDNLYEAWNITGPNGLLFVCKPSGDVETWGAKNES